VLSDLGAFSGYVLEEGAPDLREAKLSLNGPVFFLGDHLGIDETARARLASLDVSPLRVGPVSLHAEDAITLAHNELDRRTDSGR
jgi:tRNA (pseudouridine54-N1)-methyltransferase